MEYKSPKGKDFTCTADVRLERKSSWVIPRVLASTLGDWVCLQLS